MMCLHSCRVAGERQKVEKSFRRSSRPSTAALSSCWGLGRSEVHLKNQFNSVHPTSILTPFIGVRRCGHLVSCRVIHEVDSVGGGKRSDRDERLDVRGANLGDANVVEQACPCVADARNRRQVTVRNRSGERGRVQKRILFAKRFVGSVAVVSGAN